MSTLIRPAIFSEMPVCAAFTTRTGLPGERLHLGHRPAQESAALERAWGWVLGELGVASVALVDQVHGNKVITVSNGGRGLAQVGEGDALITTTPGLALAVRVADCVPLLLAAPGGVAAVHAGWRGTAGAIAVHAVRALCAATGSAPEAVRVAIGPHILGDVYEVGEAVVEEIAAAGVPRGVFAHVGPRGTAHADLAAALRFQLRAVGVTQVEEIRRCTLRDSELWSYRGEGALAGRQAGVIALCG